MSPPRVLPAALALASALLVVAAPALRSSPAASAGTPSNQELLDQAGADVATFDPRLAAVSCPVERGPVKEGADADRYRVGTTATSTTVASLRAQPKPAHYPTGSRIAPVEERTWQLRGVRLVAYKLEPDGDLHLVLRDADGLSMVAEIPYAACVPATSRWRRGIAAARSTFGSAYSPTGSFRYTDRLVDVRGLGFFDVPHGQTGAAPNGIELHPVVALTLR